MEGREKNNDILCNNNLAEELSDIREQILPETAAKNPNGKSNSIIELIIHLVKGFNDFMLLLYIFVSVYVWVCVVSGTEFRTNLKK